MSGRRPAVNSPVETVSDIVMLPVAGVPAVTDISLISREVSDPVVSLAHE